MNQGGINVVGIEDGPPSGWIGSAVSHGGSWDAEAKKVKWVFLTEPFPTSLTYDVAPPVGAVGNLCFTGDISFDGPSVPIDGDDCLAVNIPAMSATGLAFFATGLLLFGWLLAARRMKGARRCVE